MKIAEKLAELKQKEGELHRLYELRSSLARKSFKDTLITVEGETPDNIAQKREQFTEERAKRIKETTKKIKNLKEYIVKGRNKVNQKNIELGIDKNLIEMKYVRLELSKLMDLIQGNRLINSFDVDLWDELGIQDRIKKLEKEKSQLDAQIQAANWQNKL